jgi:LmbE family N-acetylglucosaminyl deacetylase
MSKRLAAALGHLRLALARKSSYRFFLKDWIRPADLDAAAELLATMRFRVNLRPVAMAGPEVERVTVVAPHCDDEVIGPGGTLAGAIAAGTDIHVVYLTPDDGTPDARTLRAEAQASAEYLGYRTSFLGFRPRAIPIDAAACDALAAALTATKPQALLIPFLLDDHDDHRRANHLLLEMARRHLREDSMLVWAYQVYTALPGNVVVDITSEVSRKAEAIRHYRSQMSKRDWVHYALGLNAMNVRFTSEPGARYYEAFFVVPLGDYLELCSQYFDRAPSKCYNEASYWGRYGVD